MGIKKSIKIYLQRFNLCKIKNTLKEYSIEIDDNNIPECPICFKDTTQSMITFLKCDHWACSDCMHKLANLKKDHRRCHMCRLEFPNYPHSGEI